MSNKKLNKMCRTCLESNVFLSDIYTVSTLSGTPIIEVLHRCAPVNIAKDDGLPSFICQSCLAQVLKFHRFQLQVLESEKILLQYKSKQQLSPVELEPSSNIVASNYSIRKNVFDANAIIKLETDDDVCSGYSVFDYKNRLGEYYSTEANNDAQEIFNNTSCEDDLPNEERLIDIKEEFDDNEIITDKNEEINIEKKFIADSNFSDSKRKTTSKYDFDPDILQADASINTFYRCYICATNFLSKNSLSTHIKEHVHDTTFQCDVCEQTFSRKNALSVHKRLHTSEKLYQCDVCNKTYSQKHSLTVHKTVHNKEKSYECNFCSKFFLRKSQLQRHERTHSQEKPYQCEVCNKWFTEKCNLISHARVHTGVKRYQCNICNKKFTHFNQLRRHRLQNKC